MVFRIDDFKAEVSKAGGFAMGNLFRVLLPPLRDDSRSMSIICKAASLPGRQLTSTEYQKGIYTSKIAYGYLVDDVTLTFHLLNDYKVKTYFEEWQKLAVNDDTGEIGYYNDYTHPVIIQQLKKGVSFPIKKQKIFDSGKIPSSIRGRLPRLGPLDLAQGEIDVNAITSDQIVYSCLLEKAYPTTVNAVELGDEAQLLELTVQLSYKNWKGQSQSAGNNFLEGLAGELIRKFL